MKGGGVSPAVYKLRKQFSYKGVAKGEVSPSLPSPHFVAVLSATPSAGEIPRNAPLKILLKGAVVQRYNFHLCCGSISYNFPRLKTSSSTGQQYP